MVAEDAAISNTGYCEFESWTQRTPAQTEYWAVPACNLAGRWELAAGLGHVGPDGPAGGFRLGVVQAKTVFRPLEKNGWGIGLAVANQFRPGDGVLGDLSVVVPVSLSLLDDRVLLHANLGWLRARSGAENDGLWAAGAEWAVRPRLALTLETYGTVDGHGYTQAGARFSLIPDRLALDAAVGTRLGRPGAGRYVTFGLTYAAPVPR